MENTKKIDLLIRSKIAKTMFAQNEQDTVDLRACCIAEIEHLRSVRLAERKAAEERLKIAQAEAQQLGAAYRTALQKVREMSFEVNTLRGDPPQQIHFEKILQKIGPQEVSVFLKDLIQLEKRALASYRPRAANDDGAGVYTGHSNASSIVACITAIRQAREKANAMLKQTNIEDEAIATLDKLRSGILQIHPCRE